MSRRWLPGKLLRAHTAARKYNTESKDQWLQHNLHSLTERASAASEDQKSKKQDMERPQSADTLKPSEKT